jgi:hypothetical protein
MRVRIRFETGPPIQRKSGKNRHLASACGALLIPASLMAYVLGLWSLTSDMGMSNAFGITGVLSHWQVWIAVGVLLHAFSSILNRYARVGELQVPKILNLRISSLRPLGEPLRPTSDEKPQRLN